MAAAQATTMHEVIRCDLSQATEEQLLLAAKAGSEDAFAELMGRYSSFVRARILRIVRNHEDAEDVVQEASLTAFIHLDQFRGSARFSTWFTRIAINQALMLLRKRKTRTEISFDNSSGEYTGRDIREFSDHAPGPESIYVRKEVEEKVQRAVQRLPLSFRGLVDLFYREECSVQESAETLGISVPAAKSRLMRARVRLRRYCSGGITEL
jgi:RNA polymerase sigma-70 factor, ECF subfamily